MAVDIVKDNRPPAAPEVQFLAGGHAAICHGGTDIVIDSYHGARFLRFTEPLDLFPDL